jgi:phosphohistidine phosphatase SixA
MKTVQHLMVIVVSFLFVAGAFTALALAQNAETKSLIQSLNKGGYVIVLRHGDTNHDQTDILPPDYNDVTKQRRLSDKGRETARQIGGAVKKLGISFDKVETSKLDRGVETGTLVASGEVTPILDLTESNASVTPDEKERRATALRVKVGVMPATGQDTLLVTHKPNIVDAFGKALEDIGEGEAAVFKPDGTGKADLVGRIKETDWRSAE